MTLPELGRSAERTSYVVAHNGSYGVTPRWYYVVHGHHPVRVKRCATCTETKPVAEFHPVSRNSTLEYRSYCKPCARSKRRAAYEKAGGKDVPYAQVLKREYGLTLEQYNDMLKRQAHRCAVCRRPETVTIKKTGEVRRLAVDHDHVTGTVRGLLCHRCNILVWAMEDNHTTLSAIEKYVENFRNSFAK